MELCMTSNILLLYTGAIDWVAVIIFFFTKLNWTLWHTLNPKLLLVSLINRLIIINYLIK